MPGTLQAANEATETREDSVAPVAPVATAPPSGTMPRRRRHGRIASLVTRLRWTSYHDSLFERPDLIEDDYYRLANQPRD